MSIKQRLEKLDLALSKYKKRYDNYYNVYSASDLMNVNIYTIAHLKNIDLENIFNKYTDSSIRFLVTLGNIFGYEDFDKGLDNNTSLKDFNHALAKEVGYKGKNVKLKNILHNEFKKLKEEFKIYDNVSHIELLDLWLVKELGYNVSEVLDPTITPISTRNDYREGSHLETLIMLENCKNVGVKPYPITNNEAFDKSIRYCYLNDEFDLADKLILKFSQNHKLHEDFYKLSGLDLTNIVKSSIIHNHKFSILLNDNYTLEEKVIIDTALYWKHLDLRYVEYIKPGTIQYYTGKDKKELQKDIIQLKEDELKGRVLNNTESGLTL